MTGVLIAFYSRTGVTEKLAYAVAEEALEAERTCACAASAISLRNTLSKRFRRGPNIATGCTRRMKRSLARTLSKRSASKWLVVQHSVEATDFHLHLLH